MHEIILILNYDEDVNKEKLDQVIGEQVYSNYNRLYTNTGKNNLHDFIKQIMINVVGDTLVFPDFILTQEDLQAFYTVMSGEYTVNIIQFINNWDKDKLTAKEYNDSVFYAAQYCDSIYLVNETTGFYKNYSDHLLEARYLLDILSNNLNIILEFMIQIRYSIKILMNAMKNIILSLRKCLIMIKMVIEIKNI